MSIETHPGKKVAAPPPPLNWGELTPDGKMAHAVRFTLEDREVVFPLSELRRWEHSVGENEVLIVSAGKEQVVIEGRELSIVRAALDLGRLCELRINFTRATPGRPGPRITRIAIETA